MESNIELTLEQQFSLKSFESQVARMSHEQMMIRETMYRHFLKHQWGIDSSPKL